MNFFFARLTCVDRAIKDRQKYVPLQGRFFFASPPGPLSGGEGEEGVLYCNFPGLVRPGIGQTALPDIPG